MANEPRSARVRTGLREKLGTDLTDDLLDMLSPLEHDDLARRDDVLANREDFVKLREDVVKLRVDMVDLKGQIAQLDARVDKLDARVDKLDARVDKLDAKVDKIDAKIDKLDTKLTGRIDALEATLVPKLIKANIASIIVGAGLVIGAIKLV